MSNNLECPADLANTFLSNLEFKIGDKYYLRSWQQDFYIYEEGQYRLPSKHDLKATIVKWLQDGKETRSRAKNPLVTDILVNLTGMTFIKSEYPAPSWLNLPPAFSDGFVSLKNGILNLEKWIMNQSDSLLPATLDFFSLSSLPFKFDPKADCPRWRCILNQILPDQQIQDLLQEWFGYNLTAGTSQGKFVILFGEGANGKGIVTTVLREVLGDKNTTALSLEAFDPQRTFPLAATAGKLANICEEIGEMNKAAEGILKQYVTGGILTVERKHQDPFDLRPTAKLTFATNVLPHFSDKSDGIWRRIIVVPFQVQILDESKQDKRLISPEFWRNFGELPGILNWALEGVARLTQRGYFIEPLLSKQAKEQYKLEVNPAKMFLLEHFEYQPGSQLRSTALYSCYKTFCTDRGHQSASEVKFSKEVSRAFPYAKKSKNAQRIDGGRGHIWTGIKEKSTIGADGTDDTDFSSFVPTTIEIR